MRGYAPTAVPRDGNYSVGALVADAGALHEVMGGDEQAVLIGSDWGAETVYGAAAFASGRWRPAGRARGAAVRAGLRAVPRLPAAQAVLLPVLLPRSGCAGQAVVAADGMALVDQLWRDWSPGYDAAGHLAEVKDRLRDPVNLNAAIGYYRAPAGPSGAGGAGR